MQMSYWTYINGTITVDAIGRTQAEKEYILRTVLDHLPLVTGSEEDVNVYLIQANGHDCSSSVDEFVNHSNQLVDSYGAHSQKCGWLKTQSKYIIVVNGALRDRTFDTTFTEFNKWLCRLAKRVRIDKVLVELTGEDKIYVFDDHSGIYRDMFEYPSWSCLNDDGEPAWWEYLMWQPDSVGFPRQLAYKYYDDPYNDKRVENWIQDTKRRRGFERRH